MFAVSSSSSSLQTLSSLAVTSRLRGSLFSSAVTPCRCHCSLTGFREMSTQSQTLKNDGVQLPYTESNDTNDNDNKKKRKKIKRQDTHEEDEEEEEEGKWISKIQVPRQKYIPISKTELLSGILSNTFDARTDNGDDDQVQDFLLLSS